MDRGTWRTTVHRVKKSQTGLKRLTMHTRELNYYISLVPGIEKGGPYHGVRTLYIPHSI